MPVPQRVIPLVEEIGRAAGHRLVALSLEVYDDFADLRFARIDVEADRPLQRRIPPPEAWDVSDDEGFPFRVVDAVGRGDRSFSNGEVRLQPTPGQSTSALVVEVALAPDHEPLRARVELDGS